MDGPYRGQVDDGDGNRLLVDAYFSLSCAAKALSHVSAVRGRWMDNRNLIESARALCLDANAKLVDAANRLACTVPDVPAIAPAFSRGDSSGHGHGQTLDWFSSLTSGYRVRRVMRDIARILDKTSARGSATLRDLPQPP